MFQTPLPTAFSSHMLLDPSVVKRWSNAMAALAVVVVVVVFLVVVLVVVVVVSSGSNAKSASRAHGARRARYPCKEGQ